MTFTQRLSYFGGGLFLGIIFLFFFLSGKKTSCDYSPNARVLKNIRIKKRIISEETIDKLHHFGLDTSAISTALIKGSVDFNRSNTELDSCKIYFINTMLNTKEFILEIENCHKKATLKEIIISELEK